MPTIQIRISEAIHNFYTALWTDNDFLTEDDVRCNLFEFLKNALKGEDDCSIHSEVRWYGNDPIQKLKFRTDLVIIDSSGLRVTEELFRG